MVEYKQGKENKVADALSRQEEWDHLPQTSEASCLFMISFPYPSCIDELKDSYMQDSTVQNLIQQVKSGVNVPKHYTVLND